MTELKFTGGSVTYGRSIKVADYENKKLDVTLSFGVSDGDVATPEQIAEVVDAAIELVHVKLGLKEQSVPVSDKGSSTVGTAASAAVPTATDKPAAAPTTAAPAGRKPKKPPVIDVVLTDEDKAEAAAAAARGNISTSPEDRVDPLAPLEDDAAKMAVEGEQAPEADPITGVEDDLTTAAAAPITDADLLDVVTKHNAKIKNAIAIKQLIGKYAPQLAAIKPELRAKFLEELHAL